MKRVLKSMSSFVNPVNDRDMPDPGVLLDGHVYWMTHTMGRLPACPLWSSTDLIHWRFERHLLDATNAPAWVHDRFWAPELHRVAKRYILLYTSGDRQGRLCIGSAVADAVTGPYHTPPDPLVSTPEMGVIDPTLFEDSDRRVYLLWKDDGNALGKSCHIFLQEMDGKELGIRLAPGTKPTTLLTSNPDGWEGGIIEGPELIKHAGWYYLFYSGNGFSHNYAEGVARSRSISGPYERCPANPILRANAVWVNPGHGAFITDRKGDWWHLYHAYHKADMQRGRVQLLDRVRFGTEGDWPVIGTDGSPTVGEQPVPPVWQ